MDRAEMEADLAKIEEAYEVEIEPGDYPWAADEDEERRAFIIERVGIAGEGWAIDYLQEVFDWLKTGRVPTKSKK